MFGLFSSNSKERHDLAYFKVLSMLVDVDPNVVYIDKLEQERMLKSLLLGYGRNMEFYERAKKMNVEEMGSIIRGLSQMHKRNHAETFTYFASLTSDGSGRSIMEYLVSLCDIPRSYVRWKLLKS